MANIRALAFSIIDKNGDVRKLYNNHLESQLKQRSGEVNKALEEALAKVYNAKVVGGSQKLVPDFLVREDLDKLTGIGGLLPFEKESISPHNLKIETKFAYQNRSVNTKTTIGGATVNSTNILPELLGSRTKLSKESVSNFSNDIAYSDTDNVDKKVTLLLEGLRKLNKESGSGNAFNFFKKYTPNFFTEAYNKAKNLVLVKVYNKSPVVYNIYFPPEKFNSRIFFMTIEKISNSKTGTPSVVVSVKLNSTFEKNLLRELDKNIIQINTESYKSLVNKLTKVKESGFTSVSNIKIGGKVETIKIGWNHTESITQAIGTLKLNVNRDTKQSAKEFGVVDITQLVQGKVKMRMRRGTGEPRPTKIYERSGTFRSSITAFADLDSKIVSYFYLPYYDSLEQYGYEIQELVEGSIRTVIQNRFNSKFYLKRLT